MKQVVNKWIFILASLIGYILFAKFRYLLVFKEANIIVIWIPAGISLAIVLYKGYKYLPLVFIGNYMVALLGLYYEGLSVIGSIPIQFSVSLINTLEAALATYLVLNFSESNLILKNSKNSVSFIIIVVFVSFITALIGAFFLCYLSNDWTHYFVVFRSWWIDDSLGIFLVTPLLMSIPKKISLKIRSVKIFELILFLLLVYAFLSMLTKTQYPIKFLLIPILLISLFRFGKFSSFITLFFICIFLVIHNSYYKVGAYTYQSKYLIIYQLYFSMSGILLIIVSSLLENKKNKEKELIKSKTQLQNILKSINEAIIVYDIHSHKILDINDFAINWLGYSLDEFKKMKVGDLASNKSIYTKKKALEYFKKSVTEAQNFNWQIKSKSNKTFYCNIQLIKAEIFNSDNIIATIRDDSEKYKLEQEIIQAYIEAQEEEKQYFGEEIHDNILQILSAEQIFINAVDKSNNLKDRKTIKYLEKLNELNLNAIDAIQKIAYGLMSKQLKEQGLIIALENLCVDLSEKGKVEFNFSYKNIREKNLSSVVKTNIFRIVQELTNDCINYSDATIANLKIRKTASGLFELIFNDNGKNLNKDTLQKIDQGRSLKNINRRLKYLSGNLVISSSFKKGFEIKITIPLS